MTHNTRTEDSKDNWMTPRDFVIQVCHGLGIKQFDFDACANARSTIAEQYTHDLETTLESGWLADFEGYMWCNPPFSQKNVLLPKLITAVRANPQAKLVALIPLGTETHLWRDWVWHEDIIFLGKRLSFLDEETGQPKPGTPFTCALLCMNLTLDELRGVDKCIQANRTVFSVARLTSIISEAVNAQTS